jgi:uncharacterized Zn finger protein
MDTTELLADTSPANLRLAKEFVAHDEVEVTEDTSERLEARVGTGNERGQRRTVRLDRTRDGIEWSCTCSNRLTRPCKHVAAVALGR